MNIRVVKEDEFDSEAADFIGQVANTARNSNICFPTGDTPRSIYRELINRVQNGTLSFDTVTAFGLDEWGGLPSGHPMRCSTQMMDNLYQHVDIAPERIYYLNPMAEDLNASCAHYEVLIRELGGLTLAILGVGLNGHIGFNEPGTLVNSRTRRVDLHPVTQVVSAKYGFTSKPQWGVTMGLATVLEAEKLLIIVNGLHKADIVWKTIYGPKTPDVPASLLRDHPGCTFILDEAAADRLN